LDDEGFSYTIQWLGRIGGISTSTSIEVEAKNRCNLKLGVGPKGAIAKKTQMVTMLQQKFWPKKCFQIYDEIITFEPQSFID
jgi:hypothetical protein